MPTPAERLLSDIGTSQPLLDEYQRISKLRADYLAQSLSYKAKYDELQGQLDAIVVQVRALAAEMRDAWGGIV